MFQRKFFRPETFEKEMPTTRRQRAAQNKFESRVTKRGSEMESTRGKKDEEKPAISPTLMYFLMFVMFGSTIFGLIQTLTSGRQF
jgi:ABC-type Na+ efflux pump permease subunit